jgi:hypothetical protein
MTSETPKSAAKDKKISDAALRALREAEERRAKAKDEPLPVEKGGRAGPEPTRYGDWEKDGKLSDF